MGVYAVHIQYTVYEHKGDLILVHDAGLLFTHANAGSVVTKYKKLHNSNTVLYADHRWHANKTLHREVTTDPA